jgi:hypothetical protein
MSFRRMMGLASMADVTQMRKRVVYLRGQATRLRVMATNCHDHHLHDRFFELASRCEEIAATIEVNVNDGIHRP